MSARFIAGVCTYFSAGICAAGPAEVIGGVAILAGGVSAVAEGAKLVDACDHYGNSHACFQSSMTIFGLAVGFAGGPKGVDAAIGKMTDPNRGRVWRTVGRWFGI